MIIQLIKSGVSFKYMFIWESSYSVFEEYTSKNDSLMPTVERFIKCQFIIIFKWKKPVHIAVESLRAIVGPM